MLVQNVFHTELFPLIVLDYQNEPELRITAGISCGACGCSYSSTSVLSSDLTDPVMGGVQPLFRILDIANMGKMDTKINPSGAPQPQRQRKSSSPENATRRNILNAASKLFRDKGYVATTLRQIGDAAGMQAGSVYYHFDSKDDMICEILDLGITYVHDAVKGRIEALGDGADMRECIKAAIDGHLYGLLSHGDFVSANIRNYGQLPEGLKERNRAIRQAYVCYWDELLDKAQKAGAIRGDLDLKVLRLFIVGSLNWTVEWYQPDKGSIDDLSRQIKMILFEGVGSNR